jgi:lipoate-protein ligase A
LDFLDLSYLDLDHNLAVDEALLLEAEDGLRGEILRFWEMPTLGVVVGSGGKVTEEVNQIACDSENIPVRRRSSGGGTVVLGPGCLCYSLILSQEQRPYLSGINDSYAWILNRLAESTKDICPAQLEGSSDLESGGLKFSGNAQQRKRRYFLHHGTLLYDFPIKMISHLLPHPPREPDYRSRRSHESFLLNLPANRTQLIQNIKNAFSAMVDGRPPSPERVQSLVTDRYSLFSWNHRR